MLEYKDQETKPRFCPHLPYNKIIIEDNPWITKTESTPAPCGQEECQMWDSFRQDCGLKSQYKIILAR